MKSLVRFTLFDAGFAYSIEVFELVSLLPPTPVGCELVALSVP